MTTSPLAAAAEWDHGPGAVWVRAFVCSPARTAALAAGRHQDTHDVALQEVHGGAQWRVGPQLLARALDPQAVRESLAKKHQPRVDPGSRSRKSSGCGP